MISKFTEIVESRAFFKSLTEEVPFPQSIKEQLAEESLEDYPGAGRMVVVMKDDNIAVAENLITPESEETALANYREH
ncbi:hypothetical protein Trydic_g13712 [Trypoxylus dichotomus]